MTTVQYHLNLRFIKFNAILKFTTAANMTAPRKMDFANQISIKNPLRPYLILSGKIGKTLGRPGTGSVTWRWTTLHGQPDGRPVGLIRAGSCPPWPTRYRWSALIRMTIPGLSPICLSQFFPPSLCCNSSFQC
jgi:hypothetical protein